MGRGSSGVAERDPHRCRARRRRRPAARRRGPPRRRPGVRGAVLALPAPHPRLRDGHGQGPRPRGGRHAGGLRLRAAPHARDRAADRVQAVDLRDRQERVHRPVPPLPAHRGGLAPGRRGPRARPTTAGSSAPTRRPTTRSTPSRSSTTCAARSAACRTRTTRSSLLRELEGLSYREIGERMGMSRPAVESTLFRARRRLTEEYDELVTGARCRADPEPDRDCRRRPGSARASRAGSRATVAYCQPCRREAMAAGLDSAILTHVPLRRRAAAKIAGLLPFPIFGPLARGAEATGRGHAPSSAGRAGWRTCRCCRSSCRGGGASWRPRPPCWWRGSVPPASATKVVAAMTAGAAASAPPQQRSAPPRAPPRPRSRSLPARGRRARTGARQTGARPSARPPSVDGGGNSAGGAGTPAGGGQRGRHRRRPPGRGHVAPAAPGREAPEQRHRPDRPGQAGDRAGRRSRCVDGVTETVQGVTAPVPAAPRRSTTAGRGRGRHRRRPCRPSRRRGAAAAVACPRARRPGPATRSSRRWWTPSLYSIAAFFHDRHPDLVEDVVAQAEAIERDGLAPSPPPRESNPRPRSRR